LIFDFIYAKDGDFIYSPNKSFDSKDMVSSAVITNKSLIAIDETLKKNAGIDLFDIIDKKVTGSIIGAMYVKSVAEECSYLSINPSSTGHPDLIPSEYAGAKEVNWDQFPYGGIEVKTSCGNLPTGVTKELSNKESRISRLNGVVWKGHHNKINNLLAIFWDYVDGIPCIAAGFYSRHLTESDFTNTVPKPGGGHTTNVCITKASAIKKLGQDWVFVADTPEYKEFFKKKFHIEEI